MQPNGSFVPQDDTGRICYNPRMTTLEQHVLTGLRAHSAQILRFSLGVVFLWFGVMKLMMNTPVTELLAATYTMLPVMETVIVLGVLEVFVAIGLLCGIFLRTTIAFTVLHLLGTFFTLALNPSLFFEPGQFWILTFEGEFIIKNVVLLAAALVIAGHQTHEKKYGK